MAALSPEAKRHIAKVTLEEIAQDPNYNILEAEEYKPSAGVTARIIKRYFENKEVA